MDEDGLLRGVQEQLPVDRQGRSYSQPLARAVVDFIGDGIQLLLAVVRHFGVFAGTGEPSSWCSHCCLFAMGVAPQFTTNDTD